MKSSKEKILNSAKELIHANGYESTSVDEIAECAGVTKSNLYYHFKSKEEIGLLVLDLRIREFEEEILAPAFNNKSLNPASRLKNYYKGIISYQKQLDLKLGCPLGNLALEMSNRNEKFRVRLSDFFKQLQKLIETCVREGIDRREIRDDVSPKALSLVIFSHAEGAMMTTKTNRHISALSAGSKAILKLLENK